MAKSDEYQEWLDALAGNPNPNSDPSLTRKSLLLRRAIQEHGHQIIGTDYDIEAELQRLNARLTEERLLLSVATAKNFTKRWAAFAAAILSAFAFGIITMRIAMMPAMESVRSDGKVLSIAGDKQFVQIVQVSVPDPFETMKACIYEASQVGLNFSVAAADDGYDLILEGLMPNSVAQKTIKQLLGLSNSAAGDLQFQIRKNQNN